MTLIVLDICRLYDLIAVKLGGYKGAWTRFSIENLLTKFTFVSVVGLQAGDEGKGHVAVEIARRYRSEQRRVVVCGGSGGANAGHTLTHNGFKYNTNILPAAFMQGHDVFLGSNKLYNISSFRREVDRITTPRKDAPALTTIAELQEKLVFDNTGRVTFVTAVISELINEYNKTKTTGGSVGTTGQGISTTISQYDVKCPIEILTVYNAFKNNRVGEYLNDYYTVSNTETIVQQYFDLVSSGVLKPLLMNGKSIEGETSQAVMDVVRLIDNENINWFCSTFGTCFKNHNYFNEKMLEYAEEAKRCVVILEGVQANSLSPVNGPLNATTSSELNPDVLMQTSFKFCDFTSIALAGGIVLNVGVMKLVQSTVGHHHNPAKIKNYADLLKFEFTNECDNDGQVRQLLNDYPAFGNYAKLASLTLNEIRKTNPATTPDFLLTNGHLDESALLSRYLGETGTTTGRVRELSWLDFNRINSCSFNQVHPVLSLTRLDFYNIFKVFRYCIGYIIDGDRYMYRCSPGDDSNRVFSSYKDFTSEQLSNAEPIYVDFKSWDGQFDLTSVKKFDDFPKEVQSFIRSIEENFGRVMTVNLSARETLFIE